jgi:hypothetical protein
MDLPPLVQLWVDTYNSGDLDAHIDLYTDDASIVLPGTAETEVDLNPGKDKKMFREVEESLDAAAPDREVRIDWVAAAGSAVCVEATLRLDRDRPELDQPIAVHFTMNAEGTKFVRDRTYVDSSLTASLGGGSEDTGS